MKVNKLTIKERRRPDQLLHRQTLFLNMKLSEKSISITFFHLGKEGFYYQAEAKRIEGAPPERSFPKCEDEGYRRDLKNTNTGYCRLETSISAFTG